MIWGMVMPNGLIAAREISGNLNSEKYIELLNSFVVPCMKLNCKPNFNFVQDNCPSHVAQKSMHYLKNQSFQVLKWPARSPDINIMENIWKMMTDIIYQGLQPQNKAELRKNIQDSISLLNSTRNSSILGLYRNFRPRLTNVLLKRGNLIN